MNIGRGIPPLKLEQRGNLISSEGALVNQPFAQGFVFSILIHYELSPSSTFKSPTLEMSPVTPFDKVNGYLHSSLESEVVWNCTV
jgi:hypothetical protein